MKPLLIITATLLSLALLILFLISGFIPGGDGVVAERTLPDGTRLIVEQKYNPGDFAYEVGFYSKEPGKDWGWCYLEHEDGRWRSARIDYDPATDTVLVFRDSTARGKWDRRNRIYSRPNVADWSTPAPQEYGRRPEFARH